MLLVRQLTVPILMEDLYTLLLTGNFIDYYINGAEINQYSFKVNVRHRKYGYYSTLEWDTR